MYSQEAQALLIQNVLSEHFPRLFFVQKHFVA